MRPITNTILLIISLNLFFTSCSPVKEVNKMLREVHRMDNSSPQIQNFEHLRKLKIKINQLKSKKEYQGIPKTLAFLEAIISMQMQKTYHEYPNFLPLNIQADDLCDETKKLIEKFKQEDYLFLDDKMFKRYQKLFDFNNDSLMSSYADSLMTVVNDSLCKEPDRCKCPCREKYEGVNNDLFRFFNVIVSKPYHSLENLEKMKYEEKDFKDLEDEFDEKVRKKLVVKNGYGSPEVANLVFAITNALIYQGLLNHKIKRLGGSFEGNKAHIKDICGRLEGAWQRAWELATLQPYEICDKKNYVSRCMLISAAPNISEEKLKPWLEEKMKIVNKICNRDTCLDKNAKNYYAGPINGYNPNKKECIYCGCTDSTFQEGKKFLSQYPPEQRESCLDSCKTEIKCGCLDTTAVNFSHDTVFNLKSVYFRHMVNLNVTKHKADLCIYSGCMDSLALNKHPRAKEDDGSCIYPTVHMGCMDRCAENFDSLAIKDDGSCIYKKCGCTDSKALNYDPKAVLDDGSCKFRSLDPKNQFDNFLIYLTEIGEGQVLELVEKTVEFRYCGNYERCLRITMNANSVLLEALGFELGKYTNGVADKFVELLLRYFSTATQYRKCFETSHFDIIAIGTADAVKIALPGIVYEREFGDNINLNYSSISPDFLVNVERLKVIEEKKKDPDKMLSLSYPGGRITNNLDLGALRAYSIVSSIIGYKIDKGRDHELEIIIGSKAYQTEEGPEYRSILFSLELPRFFECADDTLPPNPDEIEYIKKYNNLECKCKKLSN